MTKAQILSALNELNTELKNQNIRGDISMMGGAVMCLVFHSRESTQDIDAIMAPADIMQKAAFNVSQTLNLDNQFWLNDAVKVFNSDVAQFENSELSLSNLNILTASPEYMFAMKSLSARSGTNDESDLIFLKKYLNLSQMSQALMIINKFYPDQKLSIDSRLMLKDIFNE